LALTALPTSSRSLDLPSAGFTVKISLADYFIVQRALMTVQDERAAPVLEKLHRQMLEQIK
jgi:hypothetical protein